ncbi:MAG: glycosyltransferase family 4 protein [Magnetococcus sp. THC-1_WYH]
MSLAAGRIAGCLAEPFEMHVFRPHLAGTFSKLPEPEEREGVIIHSVPHKHGLLHKVSAMGQAVREMDARIPFSLFHGFFLPMAHPFITNHGKRPTIASIRGSDGTVLLDDPTIRPLLIETIQRATWITSVTRSLIASLRKSYRIDQNSSVIPNAVAPYDGPPWVLPEGRSGCVATAGFFRSCKNIPLLVEAFAQLAAQPSRDAQYRLMFIGDVIELEEKNRVLELISHHHLDQQVIWTGTVSREDVFSNLLHARVFVLSSFYEGSPNAILEAASMGIPIVTTNVGDLGTIIKDGHEGLVVPPGDPIALSQAISRVLTDDALALRLSEGARALAQRYSLSEEQKAWTRLYQCVLEIAC